MDPLTASALLAGLSAFGEASFEAPAEAALGEFPGGCQLNNFYAFKPHCRSSIASKPARSDFVVRPSCCVILTSLLLPIKADFNVRLFEGPPFEIFLVATTLHISSCALLTPRLLFAALQPLRFARHAACTRTPSVCLSPHETRDFCWQLDTIAALALLRLDHAAVNAAVYNPAWLSRRLLLRFRRTLPAGMLGRVGLCGRTGRWRTGSEENRRRRDCDGLSHMAYSLVPSRYERK